jgi:hypothetical protein
MVVQNPSGYLQIGVAGGTGNYAGYAQAGNAVFRVLGGQNTMIFTIPNDNNDGKSAIKFGDSANGDWFKIKNNRQVEIDGNVGIGLTNPTEKLQVNGNIIAEYPTLDTHVATKKYVDDTSVWSRNGEKIYYNT